jgi:HK97 family phage portal protein
MNLFGLFGRQDAKPEPKVSAMAGEGGIFSGLDDPALKEFMRSGGASLTASGAYVGTKAALKNTTVLRCVSLIAFAIGMLPLHLQEVETKRNAKEHPLFKVLHRKPNSWQTAFEFRSYMQQMALTEGNAYARIVRSGNRVIALVPFAAGRVTVKQNDDWSLTYTLSSDGRSPTTMSQSEVFHLRNGMSEDGIHGLSMVKQAAEAIGLAQQTERASARLFNNGMMVGGMLKHPNKLSQEVFDRLKASMADKEGADNAFKTMILEEGMDFDAPPATGRDSQAIEQRKHQIEEIARPFGVPRPLLGVDDTSWGSGIDVLGQFFVRYALNPWFQAWEQAIERSLLSDADADKYEAKFNAGALLRGSMKDQAEFFAKGLGSGGHQPWLHQGEVRDWMDLPNRDDLPPPMGAQKGAANEPTSTS